MKQRVQGKPTWTLFFFTFYVMLMWCVLTTQYSCQLIYVKVWRSFSCWTGSALWKFYAFFSKPHAVSRGYFTLVYKINPQHIELFVIFNLLYMRWSQQGSWTSFSRNTIMGKHRSQWEDSAQSRRCSRCTARITPHSAVFTACSNGLCGWLGTLPKTSTVQMAP